MPGFKLPFQNSRPEEDRGNLGMPSLIGKSVEQENKHQQLLRWHGVETEVSGKEFIGDCPFYDCPSNLEGKHGKFSCNRQTCQWQCFMCNRVGNKYEFIREIHRNSYEQTTPHHLQELRVLRKEAIDIEELKMMQVALNPLTSEWSLPAWNSEGKIMNLYIWRKEFDTASGKEYRRVYSSPDFNQLPYGLNNLRHSVNRPIFVTEGHWDYLAFMGLLRRTKQLDLFDVLGTPGVYPRKFIHLLGGRKVFLMFDNDDPGQKEHKRLLESLARNAIMPLEVKKLEWPKGLPKACKDVSDVITHLPPGLWKKSK